MEQLQEYKKPLCDYVCFKASTNNTVLMTQGNTAWSEGKIQYNGKVPYLCYMPPKGMKDLNLTMVLNNESLEKTFLKMPCEDGR
jgi:hypothetical protein